MWIGGQTKPNRKPAKHEGRLLAQLRQCKNGGCPCKEDGHDCIFTNIEQDFIDREYEKKYKNV